MPSTVTCASCMHSSSADCVFGDARLTSSTSSRFAKTGPWRKSNSFVRWSKTLTPVMSVGSRSGVNWMREKGQSTERARAFASIVFPTPGKSSMIRWPSLTRQSATSCSVSTSAWTTRATFSTMRSTVRADVAASTGWGSVDIEQRDRLVEHRGRDPRLRRLGDALLPLARDQEHFVVLRVEPDVRSGHIVVDDEIDVLVRKHCALPLEAAVAALGAETHDHLAVLPARSQRLDNVPGRLELDRPGLGALRTLALRGLRRPVVGDGGGHEDQVDIRPRQRLVQEQLGSRRLDDLDAVRRSD